MLKLEWTMMMQAACISLSNHPDIVLMVRGVGGAAAPRKFKDAVGTGPELTEDRFSAALPAFGTWSWTGPARQIDTVELRGTSGEFTLFVSSHKGADVEAFRDQVLPTLLRGE